MPDHFGMQVSGQLILTAPDHVLEKFLEPLLVAGVVVWVGSGAWRVRFHGS